ncbi:methyltransferase domain-containing protein [Candidatus Omnitrophota bacterium]
MFISQNKTHKIIIRIISLCIILSFIFYDVIWAYPDIGNRNLGITALKNKHALERVKAGFLVKLIDKGIISRLKNSEYPMMELLVLLRSQLGDINSSGLIKPILNDQKVIEEIQIVMKEEGLLIRYYDPGTPPEPVYGYRDITDEIGEEEETLLPEGSLIQRQVLERDREKQISRGIEPDKTDRSGLIDAGISAWISDNPVRRRSPAGVQGKAREYTEITGGDRNDILKEIEENAHRRRWEYGERFVEGYNDRLYNPLKLKLALGEDPGPSVDPEAAERVFHSGLLKDEEDESLWIIKRREEGTREELVDRDWKNDGKREMLAHLIAGDVANFNEIRFVTEEDAEKNPEIFGDKMGKLSEYYLTRVVTDKRTSAEDLPCKTPEEAFSANFVANILMRKFDAHTDNVGFAEGGIPMSIDNDAVFGYEAFPHTEAGFEKFLIHYMQDVVLQTAMALVENVVGPDSPPSYQIYMMDFTSLVRARRFYKGPDGEDYSGAVLSTMRDMIRDFGFDHGFMAAQMLDADLIRKSIVRFKDLRNVRALVEAAGYEDEDLEKITAYIQENQRTLGRDVEEALEFITGRHYWLDELDDKDDRYRDAGPSEGRAPGRRSPAGDKAERVSIDLEPAGGLSGVLDKLEERGVAPEFIEWVAMLLDDANVESHEVAYQVKHTNGDLKVSRRADADIDSVMDMSERHEDREICSMGIIINGVLIGLYVPKDEDIRFVGSHEDIAMEALMITESVVSMATSAFPGYTMSAISRFYRQLNMPLLFSSPISTIYSQAYVGNFKRILGVLSRVPGLDVEYIDTHNHKKEPSSDEMVAEMLDNIQAKRAFYDESGIKGIPELELWVDENKDRLGFNEPSFDDFMYLGSIAERMGPAIGRPSWICITTRKHRSFYNITEDEKYELWQHIRGALSTDEHPLVRIQKFIIVYNQLCELAILHLGEIDDAPPADGPAEAGPRKRKSPSGDKGDPSEIQLPPMDIKPGELPDPLVHYLKEKVRFAVANYIAFQEMTYIHAVTDRRISNASRMLALFLYTMNLLIEEVPQDVWEDVVEALPFSGEDNLHWMIPIAEQHSRDDQEYERFCGIVEFVRENKGGAPLLGHLAGPIDDHIARRTRARSGQDAKRALYEDVRGLKSDYQLWNREEMADRKRWAIEREKYLYGLMDNPVEQNRRAIVRTLRSRVDYSIELKKDKSFTIFLTNRCRLGCRHFLHGFSRRRDTLTEAELMGALDFAHSMGFVPNLSGGDPWLAKELMLTAIRENKSEAIGIGTSGHWATSPEAAEKELADIWSANVERMNRKLPPARIILSLSTDGFHRNRHLDRSSRQVVDSLSMENVANIIEAAIEKYPGIEVAVGDSLKLPVDSTEELLTILANKGLRPMLDIRGSDEIHTNIGERELVITKGVIRFKDSDYSASLSSLHVQSTGRAILLSDNELLLPRLATYEYDEETEMGESEFEPALCLNADGNSYPGDDVIGVHSLGSVRDALKGHSALSLEEQSRIVRDELTARCADVLSDPISILKKYHDALLRWSAEEVLGPQRKGSLESGYWTTLFQYPETRLYLTQFAALVLTGQHEDSDKVFQKMGIDGPLYTAQDLEAAGIPADISDLKREFEENRRKRHIDPDNHPPEDMDRIWPYQRFIYSRVRAGLTAQGYEIDDQTGRHFKRRTRYEAPAWVSRSRKSPSGAQDGMKEEIDKHKELLERCKGLPTNEEPKRKAIQDLAFMATHRLKEVSSLQRKLYQDKIAFAILPALDDKIENIRMDAVKALGQMDTEGAVNCLIYVICKQTSIKHSEKAGSEVYHIKDEAISQLIAIAKRINTGALIEKIRKYLAWRVFKSLSESRHYERRERDLPPKLQLREEDKALTYIEDVPAYDPREDYSAGKRRGPKRKSPSGEVIDFSDEDALRQAAMDEPMSVLSRKGWDAVVYGNSRLAAKVPRNRAPVHLSGGQRDAIRGNRLLAALDDLILMYVNRNVARVVKQYIKVLLKLLRGEIGIFFRESPPITGGYKLALERLDPGHYIPFGIVEDLEVKRRYLFGIKAKKRFKGEIVVQERVDRFLINELKALVRDGDDLWALARIDDALSLYIEQWRKGLFDDDMKIFDNTAMKDQRVCFCDVGNLTDTVEDVAGTMDIIRYVVSRSKILLRKELPPKVLDYFERRVAELFTVENFNENWRKDLNEGAQDQAGPEGRAGSDAGQKRKSPSGSEDGVKSVDHLLHAIKYGHYRGKWLTDAIVRIGRQCTERREDVIEELKYIAGHSRDQGVADAAACAVQRISAYMADIPEQYVCMDHLDRFDALFESIVKDGVISREQLDQGQEELRSFRNAIWEINKTFINGMDGYGTHKAYPRLCRNMSIKAQYVLRKHGSKYGWGPEAIEVFYYPPFMDKQSHVFMRAFILGVDFIIDCSADQFARPDNNTIVRITPVVVPAYVIDREAREKGEGDGWHMLYRDYEIEAIREETLALGNPNIDDLPLPIDDSKRISHREYAEEYARRRRRSPGGNNVPSREYAISPYDMIRHVRDLGGATANEIAARTGFSRERDIRPVLNALVVLGLIVQSRRRGVKYYREKDRIPAAYDHYDTLLRLLGNNPTGDELTDMRRQIKIYDEIIEEYSEKFGDPSKFVEYSLSTVLAFGIDSDMVATFRDLISYYTTVYGEMPEGSFHEPSEFLEYSLPHYIDRFKGKIIIIKIGGAIMEDPKTRVRVLKDVVFLSKLGIRPVLVHGAGKLIDEVMRNPEYGFEIEPRKDPLTGLRITDAESIPPVRKAFRMMNDTIVAQINALGGRARGLDGCEDDLFKVTPKPKKLGLGYVGDLDETRLDTARIEDLARKGITPVIIAMGMGYHEDEAEAGEVPFNVNADPGAVSLFVAFDEAVKLILMTDTRGVLVDPDDDTSIISTIPGVQAVEALISEGIISGGMIPKARACAEALDKRKWPDDTIHLISGKIKHSLIYELFTHTGVGTQFTNNGRKRRSPSGRTKDSYTDEASAGRVRHMLKDGLISAEEFAEMSKPRPEFESLKNFDATMEVLGKHYFEGADLSGTTSTTRGRLFTRLYRHPIIIRKTKTLRECMELVPEAHDIRRVAELRYGLAEDTIPMTIKDMGKMPGHSEEYYRRRYKDMLLPYLRSLIFGKHKEAIVYLEKCAAGLRTGSGWYQKDIDKFREDVRDIIIRLSRKAGIAVPEAAGPKISPVILEHMLKDHFISRAKYDEIRANPRGAVEVQTMGGVLRHLRRNLMHVPETHGFREVVALRYGLTEDTRPMTMNEMAKELKYSRIYYETRYKTILPYLRHLNLGNIEGAIRHLESIADSLIPGRGWDTGEIKKLKEDIRGIIAELSKRTGSMRVGPKITGQTVRYMQQDGFITVAEHDEIRASSKGAAENRRVNDVFSALRRSTHFMPASHDFTRILELRYGLFSDRGPMGMRAVAAELGIPQGRVIRSYGLILPYLRMLIAGDDEEAIVQLMDMAERMEGTGQWSEGEAIRFQEEIMKILARQIREYAERGDEDWIEFVLYLLKTITLIETRTNETNRMVVVSGLLTKELDLERTVDSYIRARGWVISDEADEDEVDFKQLSVIKRHVGTIRALAGDMGGYEFAEQELSEMEPDPSELKEEEESGPEDQQEPSDAELDLAESEESGPEDEQEPSGPQPDLSGYVMPGAEEPKARPKKPKKRKKRRSPSGKKGVYIVSSEAEALEYLYEHFDEVGTLNAAEWTRKGLDAACNAVRNRGLFGQSTDRLMEEFRQLWMRRTGEWMEPGTIRYWAEQDAIEYFRAHYEEIDSLKRASWNWSEHYKLDKAMRDNDLFGNSWHMFLRLAGRMPLPQHPRNRGIPLNYERYENINSMKAKLQALSDEEFKKKAKMLKETLNKTPYKQKYMDRAYAVFRDAARRVVKMEPYKEQVLGAIALDRDPFERRPKGVALEMFTSEGKTLTIAMTAYFNVLQGGKVHVHTFNEYLAQRDCQLVGEIFEFLGLSAGVLVGEQDSYLFDPKPGQRAGEGFPNLRKVPRNKNSPMSTARSRRRMYEEADVIYGTKDSFIFDFLRDRHIYGIEYKRCVGAPPRKIIVDEGDTAIDESSFPLMVGDAIKNFKPEEEYTEVHYVAVDELAESLIPASGDNENDYRADKRSRRVSFSEQGRRKIEAFFASYPPLAERVSRKDDMYYLTHQAVCAKEFYKVNVDYTIEEGAALVDFELQDKLVVVDQFTGRMKPNHVWSWHINQFLEVRNGLKVSDLCYSAEEITYHNYYRAMIELGSSVSFISGTIGDQSREFKHYYDMETVTIPRRFERWEGVDKPPVVVRTKEEQYKLILRKVQECQQRGQPVLIFAENIEEAERLRKDLLAAEPNPIPASVLNGRDDKEEVLIVRHAGEISNVTIATNAGGRGVHIYLGEGVAEKGGLSAILTFLDYIRRCDNQKKERVARNANPGEAMFIISLEDTVIQLFGEVDVERGLLEGVDIETAGPAEIIGALRKVQERSEMFATANRERILIYDELLDPRRKVAWELREAILNDDKLGKIARSNRLVVLDNLYWEFLSKLDHIKRDVGSSSIKEYIELSREAYNAFLEAVYGKFGRILLETRWGWSGLNDPFFTESGLMPKTAASSQPADAAGQIPRKRKSPSGGRAELGSLIERLKSGDGREVRDAAVEIGSQDPGNSREEIVELLRNVVLAPEVFETETRAAALVALQRMHASGANIPPEYCNMDRDRFIALTGTLAEKEDYFRSAFSGKDDEIERFADLLERINDHVISRYRRDNRYPVVCGPANDEAYLQIPREYDPYLINIPVEYPFEIADSHYVVSISICGMEFILDYAAEQFERIDKDTILEVSPVLIPVDELLAKPERFPPYIFYEHARIVNIAESLFIERIGDSRYTKRLDTSDTLTRKQVAERPKRRRSPGGDQDNEDAGAAPGWETDRAWQFSIEGLKYYTQHLKGVEHIVRGSSVLGIGEGFLQLALWCKNAGADKVVATDINEEMLAFARMMIAKTKDPIIAVRRADMTQLPPDIGEYDIVAGGLVFAQFSDSGRRRALRECRRVTPDDGLLLFVVHNDEVYRITQRGGAASTGKKIASPLVHPIWSRRLWREALIEAGFPHIEMRFIREPDVYGQKSLRSIICAAKTEDGMARLTAPDDFINRYPERGRRRSPSGDGASAQGPTYEQYSHMDIGKFTDMLRRVKQAKGEEITDSDRSELERFEAALGELSIKAAQLEKGEGAQEYGHTDCKEASVETEAILKGRGFGSVDIHRIEFMPKDKIPSTVFGLTDHIVKLWQVPDKPFEYDKYHTYIVARIAGEYFIIDLSAGQYVMEHWDDYKRCNLGAFIVPVDDLDGHSWPYANGRIVEKTEDYSFLSKEINPYVRSTKYRLTQLTRGDALLADRILHPEQFEKGPLRRRSPSGILITPGITPVTPGTVPEPIGNLSPGQAQTRPQDELKPVPGMSSNLSPEDIQNAHIRGYRLLNDLTKEDRPRTTERVIPINVESLPSRSDDNEEALKKVLRIIALKQLYLNKRYGSNMIRFAFVKVNGDLSTEDITDDNLHRIYELYNEVADDLNGQANLTVKPENLKGHHESFVITDNKHIPRDNRSIILEGRMELPINDTDEDKNLYLINTILDISIAQTILLDKEEDERIHYYDDLKELYRILGVDVEGLGADEFADLFSKDYVTQRSMAEKLAIPAAQRHNLDRLESIYEKIEDMLIAA